MLVCVCACLRACLPACLPSCLPAHLSVCQFACLTTSLFFHCNSIFCVSPSLQALQPLGIGVATGEMCQNRIMFKQFLMSGAMQYCQIDSCRVGGVSENVAIILMAKKFGGMICRLCHNKASIRKKNQRSTVDVDLF